MAEIVKQEYKLDEKAIGEITGFMEKWFTEHKIQHKNRSVFILESMLCDINDHYQEPVDITVGVVTRFGYSNIIVTYNGEAFNPVEGEEGSPQTQYFMTRMGFIPTYSYKNKKNILTLEIPGNNLKQETLLLIAVIGAIILGVVGSALPEEIVLFVSEYILSTVSTIFMNLLGIFSGILIFLSLVSGICGMGSVSELSFKGKYMLTKLVKTMAI